MTNGEEARGPIFIDIRRYYCEYCGICRSKKSLISRHILSEHEEEMKEKEGKEEKEHGEKLNTCDECGASFRKPAHLKQHMQSHSLERPFICPVDDCHSSYRRKDHLSRHKLQHEGKLFECPIEGCKHTFAYQGNMTRHVSEFHEGTVPTANVELPKEHVCSEHGCGKAFKYPSRLHKHEGSHGNLRLFYISYGAGYIFGLNYESPTHGVSLYMTCIKLPLPGHLKCAGNTSKFVFDLCTIDAVKLDSVEALCGEPGCMKYFSNLECLKEHMRSCHKYIMCEKCGKKQLKKNMKRHIRMHDEEVFPERIKCSFEDCSLTFSNTSNLNQHIKAVHLELKPFTCSIPGCDMKFAFKHVRDNHENSGCHAYTLGDFEESDEQFRSRPRGGRKRKFPVIESLMRKRVVPPSESELDESSDDH